MPPVKLKDIDVPACKGLNNVTDPMRLGLPWLTVARNIDITDTGAKQRRDGYTLDRAGTITGAYSTLDFERMYYVDAGSLKNGAGVTLASITGSGRMQWCEINEQVYYCNGTSDGVIQQDDEVLPWSWTVPASPTLAAVTGDLPAGLYRVVCTQVLPDGRETGTSDEVSIQIAEGQALQISAIPVLSGGRTRTYIAPANSQVFGLARDGTTETSFVWNSRPDALGRECSTYGLDPLPAGVSVVQMWNGRAWACVYDTAEDVSYLFPSAPLAFHLFDLEAYVAIKGEIVALAPTGSALVIGTRATIASLDADNRLTLLAGYGMVPGWSWAFDPEKEQGDEGQVILWTTRGVCSALPFKNLTERHVSVAPGVQAGAAVIQTNGQKRFVACLHAGGTAFNART